LEKIATAGEIALTVPLSGGSSSPVAAPVAIYLGENGGFNVIGGVLEINGAVNGYADRAAAGSYLSNMGTVTGSSAFAYYAHKAPNAPALQTLAKASSIGQYENLLSGFVLAPSIQTLNAAIQRSVLASAYDATIGAADATGKTDRQYGGANCSCK
jgi:hypothetical protein